MFGKHSIIHSPLSFREIDRAMRTHLDITAVSAQLVKSAIQHPLKFPLKKESDLRKTLIVNKSTMKIGREDVDTPFGS